MTKQEFLARLAAKLPKSEREEQLAFYSEMIDDRMEEGLSEEKAVESVTVQEPVLADPQTEAAPPKRRHNAWMIVLVVLGSPIWLSLLAAAFAVIVSAYVSLWAGIISLWAGFAALLGSGAGCLLSGAGYAIGGNGTTGIAMIGAGLVCGGLSIFAFYGCLWITKGAVLLTGKLAVSIKQKFSKKENAQ